MTVLLLVLDVLIVAAAFVSGALWLKASWRRIRRISRHEVLDHADLNRIVTAMNRAQILNARAAGATACAALLAGVRLLLELVAS